MLIPIAREGTPYIIGILVISTLLTIVSFRYPLLMLKIIVFLSWVVVILMINFFRDPERAIPVDARYVISPADGEVIEVKKVFEESYLYREVTRVSIFMSLFDVHVNRAPIKGVVDYIHYSPGTYFPAYRGKASSDNEHMTIGFIVQSEEGTNEKEFKVMIRLIAGVIARRIVLWKKLHEETLQGERIGMIKFGSRVEVYLPQEVEHLVGEGDRVTAGVTIIGKVNVEGNESGAGL